MSMSFAETGLTIASKQVNGEAEVVLDCRVPHVNLVDRLCSLGMQEPHQMSE